jgi:trans-aconitate methyltransferase
MSREWDANAYHRISGPQFSWGKKVLDRISLRGSELVMDAGCGTGKLTAELLDQLPSGRVVGVDLSRNMLAGARDHLQPTFGKRALFIAADLLHLPFVGVFDGIFSTAAFHWVPDHDKLFRNLHDALKAGGWLVAQCGAAGNLDRLLRRVDELMDRPRYREFLGEYQHPWVYSDADMAAERLQRAGFRQIETSIEPAPTRFDNAEAYSEFVRKVILHRHLQRLPEELRGEFMAEIVELAARDHPAFELDYWRLNLSARK